MYYEVILGVENRKLDLSRGLFENGDKFLRIFCKLPLTP